jgi:hypothetical protein
LGDSARLLVAVHLGPSVLTERSRSRTIQLCSSCTLVQLSQNDTIERNLHD